MTAKDNIELLVRLGVWEEFKAEWPYIYGSLEGMLDYLGKIEQKSLIRCAFDGDVSLQGGRFWEDADRRLQEGLKKEGIDIENSHDNE